MVGLRPFRPQGFRLDAERIGDALVVHDYGHGGGGVTLSWGTASLACDLAGPVAGQRCAVIGAGAVGLATARTLQERGAASVTVYAAAVPPATTSDAAGAQIWPSSVFDADATDPAFRHLYEEAARISFDRFARLVGPRHGVWWQPNYLVSTRPPGPPRPDPDPALSLASFCVACGPVPRDDGPFRSLYASRFDTMMAAPSVYLPALMREIREARGVFVARCIRDPAELGRLAEPLVFDCTGLGAHALFADASLGPLKGQLTILRPQPEVRYNVIAADSYMFARPDGIALGGLEDRGDWSLAFDDAAENRIMASQARVAADLVTS